MYKLQANYEVFFFPTYFDYSLLSLPFCFWYLNFKKKKRRILFFPPLFYFPTAVRIEKQDLILDVEQILQTIVQGHQQGDSRSGQIVLG